MKPPGFDPARRYPVILSVYGGPHAQTVTNSFDAVSPLEHLLAGRGFLVWSLDNRGSAGRGLAFESHVFRDMGRVELEDHLVGVEYLQSLPYVDPARLGLYGLVVRRLPDALRPDAGSRGLPDGGGGRTRHRLDLLRLDLHRALHGHTSRESGRLRDELTLEEGGKPAASLLILHGTADDNVHLANTMAFVDALIKAGRPHSLLIHPRQMHGFRDKENRIARDAAIVEHFEKHLK